MDSTNSLEIINNATTFHGMSTPMIPCCLCGTMIYANNCNQCSTCLAQQFDLREILQRGELTIHQCRQCRRFETTKLSSNSISYQEYNLESPELLSLCLKRIPALQDDKYISNNNNNNVSNIHVTDALWVWTEPNSMRLKVRVTVRATVGESQNTVIQQRCLITYVIRFKQCPECNREYTNRTWHALVQVRQKSSSKASTTHRGLLMLEMILTKHPTVRSNVLRAETVRQGFDFYFLSSQHAQQFTNFLSKTMAIKITATTKKLISSDSKNNTANMKHTIICELVPLCRYDLVLIGCDTNKKARKIIWNCFGNNTSNIRFALVMKVSKCIRFLDATYHNGVVNNGINDLYVDLHSDNYWKCDRYLKVICSQKSCISFIVLNIEPIEQQQRNSEEYDKNELIEVEVARESDFGRNDITLRCISHLGHLLNVGDTVLGYDLTTMVLPSDDGTFYQSNFDLPDVILLKKSKSVYSDGKKHRTSQNIEKPLTRKEKRKKKKDRKKQLMDDDVMMKDEGAMATMEEKKFQLELEEYSDLENEVHDYLKHYEKDEGGIDDDVADMMRDMEIAPIEKGGFSNEKVLDGESHGDRMDESK